MLRSIVLVVTILGCNALRRPTRSSFVELDPNFSVPGEELIMSCKTIEELPKSQSPWVEQHRTAVNHMCQDKSNEKSMELYLDPRSKDNYKKFYGSDGWVEEAWVNYVIQQDNSSRGQYFTTLSRLLVESAQTKSTRPIVVIHFDQQPSIDLDPKKFPNLVLFRSTSVRGVSLNFNKLQAILLARAKYGVSLDSDMVMASKKADTMFASIKREVTKDYPYPMLPVHYLDRDPANRKFKKGNYLVYPTCPTCPEPTMRWGQAQPCWSFWAMPFVARWQAAKLQQREEQGVIVAHIGEDEDLLNVALWKEGATKSMCMFQSGGIDFTWQNLYPQLPPGPTPYYEDASRFKNGIPVGYMFGHAAKDVDNIRQAVKFAQEQEKAEQPEPKPYFFKGKFYETFEEMKAAHPDDVKCTL